MYRKTEYDTAKITSFATKKSILTSYVDYFQIEKLHLRAFSFETKESVDFNLDFKEVYRICEDIYSSAMAKIFAKGQNYSLGYKGTTKSNKYNGQPESKTGYITFLDGKLYFNFTSGLGTLTPTGAIKPNGKPQIRVGVATDVNGMKEFFSYSKAMIDGFMVYKVNELIKKSECQLSEYRKRA